MPPALRPVRHEEIEAGEFQFLFTDVEFGHDGIKNLRHYIPFSQTEWFFFEAAEGHTIQTIFDSVPSRMCCRVVANDTGPKSSKIRKRILLPDDFGRFPSDCLILKVRRSNPTPAVYTMTILHGGSVDPSVSGADILATFPTPDYELKLLTPSDTYYPGDFITVEVQLDTTDVGQWAEISDIEFCYKTARGNI